jgi:hypothetical protein
MGREYNQQEIIEKLEEISDRIQSINIAEYIELVRSPKRMIFINFVSGLSRGLGIAMGATVLGAIVLTILFRIAGSNIPIIAQFVAKIIKIVETYL